MKRIKGVIIYVSGNPGKVKKFNSKEAEVLFGKIKKLVRIELLPEIEEVIMYLSMPDMPLQRLIPRRRMKSIKPGRKYSLEIL